MLNHPQISGLMKEGQVMSNGSPVMTSQLCDL
jgi:hypothetical protein